MAEMTAAEKFRQHMAARKGEVEIVTLTGAPSGFPYQFTKPSKFALLFGMGQLPQFAASEAVGKWTEEGIVQGITEGDADTLKLAQVAFTTRDRVLALSYSPKWVVGPANVAHDEISTDDIPDDDLTYAFRWVQAGGDESLMLSTFPQGSQQRPLASASRSKVRTKAKPAG